MYFVLSSAENELHLEKAALELSILDSHSSKEKGS